MSNTTVKIGDVITFQEHLYDRRVGKYSSILSAGNALINAYKSIAPLPLLPDNFIQEVINNGVKREIEVYSEFIEGEIKRLEIKSPSQIAAMRQSVSLDTDALSQYAMQFKAAIDKLSYECSNDEHDRNSFDASVIGIKNGRTVITEPGNKLIREQYTIRYQTQEECDIYSSLQQISKVWGVLRTQLDKCGINRPVYVYLSAFLVEGGGFEVTPNAILAIRRWLGIARAANEWQM